MNSRVVDTHLHNLPVTSVETAPGGNFMDLLNPMASKVSLRDIAASLSRIVRFTGYCTDQPETVAEHLLLTDWIGRYLHLHVSDQPTTSVRMRLHWLLHDAHEAYTGDIVTPMKRAIGGDRIAEIQDALDRAIYASLHLALPNAAERAEVHAADQVALRAAAADLLPSRGRWAGSEDTPDVAAARWVRGTLPMGALAGQQWLAMVYTFAPAARCGASHSDVPPIDLVEANRPVLAQR